MIERFIAMVHKCYLLLFKIKNHAFIRAYTTIIFSTLISKTMGFFKSRRKTWEIVEGGDGFFILFICRYLEGPLSFLGFIISKIYSKVPGFGPEMLWLQPGVQHNDLHTLRWLPVATLKNLKMKPGRARQSRVTSSRIEIRIIFRLA